MGEQTKPTKAGSGKRKRWGRWVKRTQTGESGSRFKYFDITIDRQRDSSVMAAPRNVQAPVPEVVSLKGQVGQERVLSL